jgi:hypothetical protein
MLGSTATARAVVTLILPAYPELDGAERRSVEDDVVRYVAGQIASMPALLQVPFALALLAFEWLPLLRYGRSFRGLTAARQASYVAWWSDARLAPMRDVMKLLRSSSLFVYFDHALVRQHLEAQRPDAVAPPRLARAADE